MFKYASLGLSGALAFVWILLNSANNTITQLEKELVIERTNFEIVKSNNEELISAVDGYLMRSKSLNKQYIKLQNKIDELVNKPIVTPETILKIKTIYKEKIINSCAEGFELLTDETTLRDLSAW